MASTPYPQAESAPHRDDSAWARLRAEALAQAEREPVLAKYLSASVLEHEALEGALAFQLASKLSSPHLPAPAIFEFVREAFDQSPALQLAIRADLEAIVKRDPACRGISEPFLHYKGFHALQSHRVSHWLWQQGRHALARYLQNRNSEVFAVDIHPAATIGKGILIDHATSVVIGETAVVDDDVSMLHEVTLGGTGKTTGDRHPKVRHGVLIGAGAKILGNVVVGEGSKVAAGSVVLSDVPPHTTVAGVPAMVVGVPATQEPSLEMDHRIGERLPQG